MKIRWITGAFALFCLVLAGRAHADYVAQLGSSNVLNDFRYAAVGNTGIDITQILWSHSTNTMRLAGRFKNTGSRYLYVTDDGSGAQDGRYRTNVTAAMTFNYYSSVTNPVPTSSNTYFFFGLRSWTNQNFRNTPTYRVAVTSTLFVLQKEFNWSLPPLNLASYTLPDYIGSTNTYRLIFSATEAGTNTYGEIVDLSAALYENGTLVNTLTYQDIPTNSTINNPGNSLEDGYIGMAAGQEWTNTSDAAWRGIEVSEFTVKSVPAVATLGLAGHDAMAVGQTNWFMLTRGGEVGSPVTIDLSSSNPGRASVPGTAGLGAGSWGTTLAATGQGFGPVTISATQAAFPSVSTTVMVFDVGYDDASYAREQGAFATATNARNSGVGFQPWIIQQNATNAVGYTNFASIFISNSLAAGPQVNVDGRSFGLLAYQTGSGGDAPSVNAIRPFNQALQVGQAVSVNLGVSYRNGSKGMKFQNSGASLFEVAVYNDDYWCKVGTNAPVSLGWAYAADTKIGVVLQRVADQLYDIALTREGSLSTQTNLGVISLGSTPPNELLFYNYNTDSSAANNHLYFNRLALYSGEQLPVLSLDGQDGMAVAYTNTFTVSRSGPTNQDLTVNLASTHPAVASVPATVVISNGQSSASFAVVGVATGSTAITVSYSGGEDFGDSQALRVVDYAYDDTSYYPPSSFADGNNSGNGFGAWIIGSNNGAGDGYTNYAGVAIGSSTDGGPEVNASEGSAFLVYANGEGPGDPYAHAIRPFGTELPIGQAVSVELGVNYRNGTKGVNFQNSGNGLFEFLVFGDAYTYKAGTNDVVNLGWDYAGDSRIVVDVKRVQAQLYDITFTRYGSAPTSTALGVINLGSTAPNEMRLYTYNTDSGDAANNLYFNRLIRYAGYELPETPVLSLEGYDGMVVHQTNVFTVYRTGSTSGALTVNLASSVAGVIELPASVEISAGQSQATFEVVGVSNNLATLSADAAGATGDSFVVAVVDLAYDDTTYYPPAGFTNSGNGGYGFQPWVITLNDGPGEGFTNYVGASIGDSSASSGNINSSEGNAFLLYANGDGTDAHAPLAQASRDFATLGIGESITVDLGVNYRNGAKGVMVQSGDTWLFEFAVFNDAYHYNVRDLGGNTPVDLGWSYAIDSAINVTLSRTGASTYNARFLRGGSAETQTLVQAISLSQPPDRLRFYVYDTDSGGDANNLYINRLEQLMGIVGEGSTETDGVPNAWWDRYGIGAGDRVATNNPDSDTDDNYNEYIADTDPTNSASFFPEIGEPGGLGILSFTIDPTSTARVYDVWWTTNLQADPQAWFRYGLDVPGNGSNVTLQVTNDLPMRTYRTGVALP